MNNKKQIKQPVFAEVNLTGDEFLQSPSTHMQRTRFLKLVYPNDVTLILPGDIRCQPVGTIYPHKSVNHGKDLSIAC